jgi:hypothetical protein
LAIKVVGAISSVMVCGMPALIGLSGGCQPIEPGNSIGSAAIFPDTDESDDKKFNGAAINHTAMNRRKKRVRIVYFLP